jgi:hypothetical protein
MIGQTISHFHLLEKFPTTSGQVGEGGMSQNGPRTLFVPLLGFRSLSGILGSGMSGCRFEDPRLPLLVHNGGQAPSFLTAIFVAVWRRCAS